MCASVPQLKAPPVMALCALTSPFITPLVLSQWNNIFPQYKVSDETKNVMQRQVSFTFLVMYAGWVFRSHMVEILNHSKILDGRIVVDKTYLEL